MPKVPFNIHGPNVLESIEAVGSNPVSYHGSTLLAVAVIHRHYKRLFSHNSSSQQRFLHKKKDIFQGPADAEMTVIHLFFLILKKRVYRGSALSAPVDWWWPAPR